MTYIEKLKELKQSAPTSWPELQDYCSVGYARVVEQSEKFDSIEYKNRRSAQLICDPKNIPIFFHNQLAPRSEKHSDFFHKLICIMLSLNRKRKIAD